MYKLVFSDMDETFLDGESRIPEANLVALKKMRDAGVLFVPSSGRPWRSIRSNFANVDRALMDDSYIVSLNGGFINRFDDPEPLTTTSLDREVAEQLYAYGFERGLCMHINVPSGTIFCQNVTPEEHAYLSGVEGTIELDGTQADLSFTDGEDVVKILYVDRDFEALQRLGEEISQSLDPAKVEITYSSKRYLELVPAGMNKGVGLRRLSDMLGVDISETIAVGDSANDLAMIQAAGLGVGVSNITDDVRPYCDAVLETSGPDGAFMELYERFIAPDL